MEWGELRQLFPAVQQRTYLNTAGGGPVSTRAAAAGLGYYEQSLEDGDIHWDEWLTRVEATRAHLARFLATDADNLAFLANASTGLNIAAHMLAGRGRVLAMAEEFPSCTLPFQQQGFDIDFVPARGDGGFNVADLEGAASTDTGVLMVSFVQYKQGYRNDLVELGAFCREHDLAFVVDATQGFGAFPIDAAACGADFLSFSGYKWANTGYSIAALMVSDRFRQPEKFPLVGWRSPVEPYALAFDRPELSSHAAALEQGHPPFAGVFCLAAALELIEAAGIERIAARIVELAHYLHARLDDVGVPLLSTRDPAHISGIHVIGVEDGPQWVPSLRERGIIVSSRGEGIRVSLHHYNNREDIDSLVNALATP